MTSDEEPANRKQTTTQQPKPTKNTNKPTRTYGLHPHPKRLDQKKQLQHQAHPLKRITAIMVEDFNLKTCN